MAKHFVAPGIGWLVRTNFNASEYGITPAIAEKMGYKRELEIASESLRKMHKRGIRILPGGDYGFALCMSAQGRTATFSR